MSISDLLFYEGPTVTFQVAMLSENAFLWPQAWRLRDICELLAVAAKQQVYRPHRARRDTPQRRFDDDLKFLLNRTTMHWAELSRILLDSGTDSDTIVRDVRSAVKQLYGDRPETQVAHLLHHLGLASDGQ